MLAVKDLYVAYGQSEALHGISFEAGSSETVAILGRNGMGKTTLFKSLMGVLPTKAGRIEVGGQDVTRDESFRRVAKGLAYVPQGRMIFPTLTVEENIETGLENSRTRRVPEDIYAMFPVLWDMRRRKGGNLSGGQQQQLAIARALATDPRVLLLDEPTEGLAPIIVEELLAAIRRIVREEGMAAIVVEQHARQILAITDRAVILDRGTVAYTGASEALAADTAVLGRFLGIGGED